ncbi:MAG: DUF350 domain-containing protein [Candidatus Buchananbacteria bacterium]|nr:DUF350 domain-containing protein [Candidatus Buchananbacteria bacterium]
MLMLSSLNEYIEVLGWIFALVIILSVAMPIFLLVFNSLTAKIDIWRELKKQNMALAIVLAGALISAGIVIALAV